MVIETVQRSLRIAYFIDHWVSTPLAGIVPFPIQRNLPVFYRAPFLNEPTESGNLPRSIRY